MLHYLLIPIEEAEQTLESINILPLEVQMELADYDILATDLSNYYQIYFSNIAKVRPTTETEYIEAEGNKGIVKYAHEVIKAISSGEYVIIPYDTGIHEDTLKNNESVSLVLNNNLLINVRKSKDTFNISIFNQHKQKEEDSLGNITITEEELK